MAKQATSNAAPSAGKTRKRAVSKVAATVVAAPIGQHSERHVSHQDIAEHAYGLYLARGASEGYAVADWLRAEHELRHQPMI